MDLSLLEATSDCLGVNARTENEPYFSLKDLSTGTFYRSKSFVDVPVTPSDVSSSRYCTKEPVSQVPCPDKDVLLRGSYPRLVGSRAVSGHSGLLYPVLKSRNR